MKHTIEILKTHILTYKRDYMIGGGIVLVLAVITILFAFPYPHRVAYQPQDACKLFTPVKAEDLLGNHVISLNTNAPTISDDVATSQCSYTDTNPNQNQMKVAAVAVRSGVNDSGVAKNKANFIAAKTQDGMQAVNGLGDSAFFNPLRGQLNVLSGKLWILISYGVGATPQNNTLADATALAHKVVPSRN